MPQPAIACAAGLRNAVPAIANEIGPADPVDDIENCAPVGGNNGSTGEGFRPVDLVGKGD